MFDPHTSDALSLPSRRGFLRQVGHGFGSVALASLLQEQGRAAAAPNTLLDARAPHFPARAKSVIWLFMTGAPSQVDTFDYKPVLQARSGEPLPGSDPKTGFFQTSGKCLKSPFDWKQYGESGATQLFFCKFNRGGEVGQAARN